MMVGPEDNPIARFCERHAALFMKSSRAKRGRALLASSALSPKVVRAVLAYQRALLRVLAAEIRFQETERESPEGEAMDRARGAASRRRDALNIAILSEAPPRGKKC